MGRSALAAAFLASLAVPLLRALAAREGGGFTGLGDELSLTALALRQGGWKLLADGKFERLELYRVAEDIGEKKDLAKKQPQRAERMTQALKAIRDTLPGSR